MKFALKREKTFRKRTLAKRYFLINISLCFLIYFHSHFLNRYYFDELKKNYKAYRDFIKKVLKEKTFEWLKVKVVDFSFELLSNKPEGEDDILMYLAKALLLPDKTIKNKVFLKYFL